MCSGSGAKALAAAGVAAGVKPKVTPHCLRHCYATQLLERGVDLRLIQEFLGHRNIKSTLLYTHLTDRSLDRLGRALEELTEGL